MTEQEARQWIADRWGDTAVARLDRYVAMLVAENERQNLIASSTIESIWSRHLVDSAQLIGLAGDAPEGGWLDIGSGGGLPGIVVAILSDRPVNLVEPRRKRAEFLAQVVADLGLEAAVHGSKVENLGDIAPPAIISARAVARLSAILQSAQRLAVPSTLWLLPKGRSAEDEIGEARKQWRGVFHVEHSVTASDSNIVVARKVSRR
jgi:16S rRNA (guanine527-N7)-methyltransferase